MVGGPMMPGGATAAASTGMTAADIWRVIRANAWMIIFLVMFSGCLGVAVNYYLARYHSRYTSYGIVQIEPRQRWNPAKSGDLEYVDWSSLQIEQRTHANLLKNEALLSQVLNDLNAPIRQTEWFKQFMTGKVANIAAAKEDLVKRFSTEPITDSKLIKVEMSCANPKDCQTIIENVVNKHLEEQQQLSNNRMLDRTATLSNLKSKYETRQKELVDRRNSRLMQLNIGAVGSSGRYNATDIEYQAAVNKQIEAAAAAAAAQGMYDTLVRQIQAGEDPPTVEQMVEHDQLVSGYKDRVISYDIAMKAASAAGKESRQIREMEISRNGYQEELDKLRVEKKIQARNALLANAQANIQSAKEALDVVNKKIETLKGMLSDLAIAMSDYLSINDELEGIASSLKDVKEQLDSYNAAAAQTQVQWAQRPVKPDVPSFPKLAITLSVSVVLGLGLALGIAFLREVMDTTVRSPRDIQRVGQMTLLGMIPHEEDDPQAAGVPLPMVIFQAPTSIMAEQYRQVRTRLQHAASLDTTRSILVTSPAPEDGKTTVACNLAAGLALNGRKILMVDANFRRPELNKVFDVPNDVGFSNALASLDNFEGAIRNTPVPNLDVMTTGQRPANPTELLESQLLIDFIERALEEYDHVIFDTGPMLLVSETAALAPRVDGVVSVVRARSNSRGLLQRLRDTLRQLKAEHLGVVLNGVRSQGGGYYGQNIKKYYEYGQVETGEAA
jgi:capsular exopolysaccharide synthesis family protein